MNPSQLEPPWPVTNIVWCRNPTFSLRFEANNQKHWEHCWRSVKGEHGTSLIVMLSEEGQQISLLQVNFMSYNNSPQKSWPIHDSFSHHQSSCMSIISSSNVMNQDKPSRCPFINVYIFEWRRMTQVAFYQMTQVAQENFTAVSTVKELSLGAPLSQWFIKLLKYSDFTVIH